MIPSAPSGPLQQASPAREQERPGSNDVDGYEMDERVRAARDAQRQARSTGLKLRDDDS
jgi:hypothetical protein